jgi:hypothetical protein
MLYFVHNYVMKVWFGYNLCQLSCTKITQNALLQSDIYFAGM